MDQAGHILFMPKPLCQNLFYRPRRNLRFSDGIKHRSFSIIQQILYKEHGMIPLFLSLHLVPVSKTVQSLIIAKTGKIQIQIR